MPRPMAQPAEMRMKPRRLAKCSRGFYTTVCGWMLAYTAKMATGTFNGLDPEGVGGVFCRGQWRSQLR